MLRRKELVVALLVSWAVLIAGLGASVAARTGVTLHMLMEDVPETRIIEQMLPEFEAATGIRVVFEIVQYADMHAKLVTQLVSARSQYDVIEVDNYWAGEFPAAGWLEPLDGYVRRDGFDLTPYLQSMLQMVGYYQGRLYMIPMYNYAMGLLYRTDLMEDPTLRRAYRQQFGTEMRVPESVEEYVRLSRFMADHAGVAGSAMQAQRGDPIVMEWSNYLFSLGGDYYDSRWVATLDSEAAIRATQLYVENLREAAPQGALSFNLDDAFRVMSQGRAFSMISYNWMLPQLNDPSKSAVAGRVALAPMPGGVGLNGGWGWAIAHNTPYKEEAWQFIKWVESAPIAKRRALMGGAPTRIDVFRDPEVLAKYPWYSEVLRLLEKAKPVPEFEFSAQMIEVVGRELSLAASGQKGIEAALQTADRELDQLARQAGRR